MFQASLSFLIQTSWLLRTEISTLHSIEPNTSQYTRQPLINVIDALGGARSEALRSVRLLLRGVSGVDFYDCWYLTFTMRLIWHLRTVSITYPSRLTILDDLEVPQLRLVVLGDQVNFWNSDAPAVMPGCGMWDPGTQVTPE